MSTRSRVRLRERLRAPVETTDPAGLARYAAELRPIMVELRALAEDATLPAGKRVYSRAYLRDGILKGLRALEARLDAAAPPSSPAP
jgi:hypothetical protein